ncbi:MAG TPA: ATP-binding protein [Pyrinomonadaceae bacterium]|jgi:hypothetical protein|nr:ATP-binding protein [Pyrinomonadaceae bacterium]
MKKSPSKRKADGGLQKSRGSLFQQYGVLLYLLIRRLETPNLEITVEPSEGEDAKIVLIGGDNNTVSSVTELIQYKKHEAPDTTHADGRGTDDWNEGLIKASVLAKWITRKRPDVSVQDILEADKDTYFTAVVFGKIDTGIKGFIPENLPALLSSYRGFWSQFSKVFPINYTHPHDPMKIQSNKKLIFSTEDVRRRVRLLRFASPSILELQCRYILEKFYKIRRSAAGDVVDKLIIEIAKREAVKEEVHRRFLAHNIEAILAEGRAARSRWQQSKEFLEQLITQVADPNLGEAPRWLDYENGLYAKFDEFEEAWDGLAGAGFVVICGPPGTGKTVLAKYLAFRYINLGTNRSAYYLRISSNISLFDEIEFLKAHIETDSLFIVDDQHLAFDEVERLVETFADYNSIGKARAKLIVTSTHTFGKTGQARRGRTTRLRDAVLIRLIYGITDKMRDYFFEVHSKTGLRTPLSNDELITLSGGNLEFAIILARCAQDLGIDTPSDALTENELKQPITNWILMKLGRNVSEVDFFQLEIVPIFIVGASYLGIPSDFTASVKFLFEAGFLEADETEGAKGNIYFMHNYWLAKLIRSQYQANEFSELARYIKKYPKFLPSFCERLIESAIGAPVLKKLFEEEIDFIVETINDPFQPLYLDDVSKILRSINIADHGGEDARLLRHLMSSDGAPNYRFFSRFIRPERVCDVRTVAVFFNTLHRIDRFVAKEVTATIITDDQINFILSMFEAPDCRLDEIGLCLSAIHRCSREAALVLYERLKESA